MSLYFGSSVQSTPMKIFVRSVFFTEIIFDEQMDAEYIYSYENICNMMR